MTFVNAPGFAMTLGPWGFAYSNTFQFARISAIYAYPHTLVTTNTIEHSGANGVAIHGDDVLVQYNTFTKNHDEWPYSVSGGQIYTEIGGSTNFTILGNVLDGGSAQCAGGCSVYINSDNSQSCSVASVSPALNTSGIEAWSPGGTYTDNYVYAHKGSGLFGGNIDGSGVSAVTGAFSSTTANQAMTVQNDKTGTFIHQNDQDGVLLFYKTVSSPQVQHSFGGKFLFSNLESTSNTLYGFEWNTSVAPLSGTTLDWGTGGTSAACLTGNGSGPVGAMPTGFSGPTSTSTCP